MVKKSFNVISYSLLTCTLLLFFQNCENSSYLPSQSLGSNSGNSSNNSNNNNNNTEEPEDTTPAPTPAPTPEPPLFSANDPISVDNIPSDKNYMLNGLTAYMNDNGFKAIAIAANGYGYMSFGGVTAVSNDQAEANKRALEACQIASNNNACSIWAEGNFVKYDESVFESNYQTVIDLTDTAYANSKVPWVDSDVRTNNLPAFSNGANQKALALSLDGGGGFFQGANNQNTAMTNAMNECESRNPEGCILYAVNGQIVLNAQRIEDFFMEHFYEAPSNF